MRSTASESFWGRYSQLPAVIRQIADKQYALFRQNPSHPSLRFRPIRQGLWTARVTGSYRAVAYREGDQVTWFWIGTHAEYDRVIG